MKFPLRVHCEQVSRCLVIDADGTEIATCDVRADAETIVAAFELRARVLDLRVTSGGGLSYRDLEALVDAARKVEIATLERFTCPHCGAVIWGEAGTNVLCSPCSESSGDLINLSADVPAPTSRRRAR